MRNGYLTGRQVAPNTFEATDNLAADLLETDLLLHNYQQFKREGNNFVFGDFKPKHPVDTPTAFKVQIDAMETYNELRNNKKERPLSFTDDQLVKMIENFMLKAGFSITSLESYKKAHNIKYGSEPGAEALIDFQLKIVALKNGEITVEALSEEFSHLVIESWNQDEISRMLQTVNNTQEYIEHGEKYREIYSKQISDPVELENAVRREVLGKMLAKSLQRDFSLENRNDTEVTFFEKLSQIFRDFITFLTGKVTPSLENDLNKMAQDIQNRLYNENLLDSLDMNQSPILTVMYAVDEETAKKIKDATKDLDIRYNDDLEKQVDGLFKDALSVAMQASSQLDKLEIDEVIPNELSATIEQLTSIEDMLLQVRSRFKNWNVRGGTQMINNVPIDRVLKFKNLISERADRTITTIGKLKGDYRNRKEAIDAENVYTEISKKYTRRSDEQIEKDKKNTSWGIFAQGYDTSAFMKLFGHVGKMSNAFVKMLHEVIKSLHHSHHIDFKDGMEKYVRPLTEHRNKLREFIKEGHFRSNVNAKKVEDAKREYELSILKITHPATYDSMTIEDYINHHQQFGIVELKEKDTPYYHYAYLYDKNINTQTWVKPEVVKYRTDFIARLETPGVDLWQDEFFRRQIDDRDSKGADKKAYIEQRRIDANPYNEMGDLKDGFTAMFYEDAKRKYAGTPDAKYVVSTNPRATIFDNSSNREPNPKDLVFFFDKTGGGELAYKYMRWNAEGIGGTNLTDAEKQIQKDTIKENFKKAYDSFLKNLDRKNMTTSQKEREVRDWLSTSLLFAPTDEYFENFSPAGINFEEFYSRNPNIGDRAEMSQLEKEYKELALKKQLIIRKYKNHNDYKEVDIQSITQSDKSLIEMIDNSMKDLMFDRGENAAGDKVPTIRSLFEIYGIGELYKDSNSDSTLRMNTAFREMFEEITGVDFDNASLKEYETFFLDTNRFNVTKYSDTYKKLKSHLKHKTAKSDIVENYKDRARNLGLDETSDDDIMKAFFISNSPSWYKRYDANESYDNFLKDFNNGKVDINDLIEKYYTSTEDILTYNGTRLDMMRITPSFKFLRPFEENIDTLYDEYKTETDNRRKFELLVEMAGLKEIHSDYAEDMSDILNNPQDLDIYIQMMDLRMYILETENMVKPQYIFMMPQQRNTNYERVEDFFKKDTDKKAWFKDYIAESFKFREDDFEDFYKQANGKIPHYGYFRLQPEELTTDTFHALVWGLNNATLYNNRVQHYGDAVKMLHGLESQEFKNGKKATDTNYHKIATEMIDFNFRGKTVSRKFEVPIGNGQTVDLSKLAFKLKGFGVFSALAFSPIVAATNLIGGIMNHSIMHMTGRKLYKSSNQRAMAAFTKMLPSTFKDIGSFDPEAKINKIMYSFGIYNLEERFANSKYNKFLRLLPQAGFSMMAMTNFPLEAQTTLSKLMEYRLIDGKFVSWRDYLLEQKTKNPTFSNRQISDAFAKFNSKSMYDFMDADGNFDMTRLEQENYTGDIKRDKIVVMGAIKEITELTTMEMASYNEAEGGRDPLLSFFLTLKKWMVISTSTMFSGRRLGIDGEEEGLIYTPKYFIKLFKTVIQDKVSFKEAYSQLDDVEQMNIKSSGMIGAVIAAMFGLAILLKGMADDDDEENNYIVQLSAYLLLRGLNETASGNIMLPESYFEAIQNPIMLGSTAKNMTNIFKVWDIDETVEGGKYDGVNKYVSGLIKATALKNPYSVSSAEVIGQTRDSYLFFNERESLYHIFNLIPEKPKDE